MRIREVSVAKLKTDQPLLSSILDRLIDEQPNVNREPEKNSHQMIADLRKSVRRDLENLLNTRWRATSWPDDLTELDQSLAGYGIPDISGEDLGSPTRRKRFLRQIEQIIKTFEPRFQKIKVLEADNADSFDRTLRFRIDAVLYAFPSPEPIVFDSSVDPSSKTFRVEGASR
jgi:type VI secretion system protein ImpF